MTPGKLMSNLGASVGKLFHLILTRLVSAKDAISSERSFMTFQSKGTNFPHLETVKHNSFFLGDLL